MNFTELKNKIKGPIYSIITPFTDTENIDYKSLSNYIEYLYNGGARIFYAMAFNTRYLLMSNIEIMEVNEFVIKKVKSLNSENIVIVGDPLNCSTKTSIEFAQHAKQHGADIISLIYRAYLFFDDHVYNHYKTIANAVPNIGILVHEMPFMKGIPQHQDGSWNLELIDKLANIPSVVAMKEDAKQDDYTRKVVDLISDRVAIVVSGNGLQQWSKVSDKCAAWLTGIGNLWPRTELDFYNAHLQEDANTCNHIIENIEKPFFWVKDNLSWHLGIKSALKVLNIMERHERMPYQPLNDEQHKKVKEIVEKINI
jgi:4-hydroxy-tetrahydrodipicolinate synthase|uniref:Dihydrodipicolinate synthase family protein n=1 Tax=viral metagenome TaxID=1070528 RepID=A0A6C0BYP8_9ZZZZ